jgi:hypothetical protein
LFRRLRRPTASADVGFAQVRGFTVFGFVQTADSGSEQPKRC